MLVLALTEKHPLQAEEAEMQEFLDRLDFDDYFSDWVSLATSVSSADLLGSSAR